MKTKSTRVTSLLTSAIMLLLSTALAAAASFNILHSFTGPDGNEPTWLLKTRNNTLWGVTFVGGTAGLGNGVLYKIDPSGTFSLVHTFTDAPDGSLPGRLIQARDGTIYGLTPSGGANFAGAVYRIDLAGNYSVIHSFKANTEGDGPNFLMQASDGFFYGTNSIGGDPNSACPNHHANGTLFRMDAAGNVTALHTFCEDIDGSVPNSLVEASDGFFYGTCKEDGPFGLGSGAGTFWKSDATGSVTVLHIFGPKTLYGDEPTQPNGVIQAADDLFYGVANGGGLDSQGAIFRADGTGNITTIHSFNDYATDGSDPETNFVLARDGFFYGTASSGGLPIDNFNRTGVVYRADTAGHVWVLHTFVGTDGGRPVAPPALDRRGKTLFTTATFQGPSNHGVTASLALKPNLPVSGLAFNPNPVTGGQSTVVTLTLARPAPAAGQVVKLFSQTLSLPASVTVPAGQTSVTFTLGTPQVSVGFDATVTAYIGSVGLSSPLTLLP